MRTPPDRPTGLPPRVPSQLASRFTPRVLTVLVVAATLATSCDRAAPPVLAGDDGVPPNLLLVTVDTLRADHLGAYGYPLPTSPHVDRLAREGVVFDEAYTPVPTTAPALASLLTGTHLERHRVRENLGRLPDDVLTLGEALAQAGYATAGFYGNGAIQNGFGQGLAVWQPFRRFPAPDSVGARKALAWLGKAREPWFLWVHFMNPHGPYQPPRAATAALVHPRYDDLARLLPASKRNAGYGLIPRYQVLPGVRRVGGYVRRYDGEIVATDAEVGRLVAALEESGQLARTLVVLTADHGESLGEDDYYFQHGRLLNEASLRVPLVLRHPGLPAGTRIAEPVSLVDLLPTLTGLLGAPVPGGVSGVDLRPLLAGKPLVPRELRAYTVVRPTRVALRRGTWKLMGVSRVRAPSPPFARLALFETGGGRERPVARAEQQDLVRALAPELRSLAREVASARPAPAVLTRAERARLRALGYVE